MSAWFQPLEAVAYEKADQTVVRNLACFKWFPKDAVVVCTEKGSMDMNILPLFVQHLNKFVRKYVPENYHYMLTLDGHGSRREIE